MAAHMLRGCANPALARSAAPAPRCRIRATHRAAARRPAAPACAALLPRGRAAVGAAACDAVPSRRNMLLATGVTVLSLPLPSARAEDAPDAAAPASDAAPEAAADGTDAAAAPAAAEPVAPPAPANLAAFTELRDAQLAYSFDYPTATGDGRQLTWVATREPCRYSAAAPLSADARQRIVAELANFKGPLTLTVTVGPAPPVLAEVGAPDTWQPRQIVGALLADRATGRVSSGQRVSLAAVEAIRTEQHGADTYIFYEAVSRGGPTMVDPKAATYRRGCGVVARRDDYFYMLSGSCPERLWPEVAPLFAHTLDSFRLNATGPEYRDPGAGLQLFGA